MSQPHKPTPKTRLRGAAALLLAAFLAACAEPALVPAPSGPLTQQDVAATVDDITAQLTEALERAAEDEGVIALQGLPQDGMMTNPFFGYGVATMRHRHPERRSLVPQAAAEYSLPRGVYVFEAGDMGSGWTRTGDSDDLSLTWTYDADPATADLDAAEATATVDWDALSPTQTVSDPYGDLELPTGLNLGLVAGGVTAADVDVATSYYVCDGQTTLEPTSLTVDGTGSFLALENVGYSVLESDAGDSVTTQGDVTLVDDGIWLGWNVAVNGELTRSACYSAGFTPQDGAVSLTLVGLAGETNSLGLSFSFADVLSGEPTVQNGTFVVNGDDANAVTFSGTLNDRDGDGVPGDDLTVRFADGDTATLEELLNDLAPAGALRRFLQRH